MQTLIDRGLQRNRLRDFLHRSVEEYQDLVCEYMNAHVVHKQEKKATLAYYESEFDFYKKAYVKAEEKNKVELERDIDSYVSTKGIRQEHLKETLHREVEKQIEYLAKEKKKSNHYDIYDHYEAVSL